MTKEKIETIVINKLTHSSEVPGKMARQSIISLGYEAINCAFEQLWHSMDIVTLRENLCKFLDILRIIRYQAPLR